MSGKYIYPQCSFNISYLIVRYIKILLIQLCCIVHSSRAMPFESKKLIGCLWNCHTSFCLSGTPCNFWTGSLKINNYNKNIGKPLNIILCVKSAIMQTRFRKVKSLYPQCDFWFMFSHCKSRVLYVNFMRNSNNLEWSPQVFFSFLWVLTQNL